MTHEPQEEYAGAGTLIVDATETPVEVTLRGHFEPLDGRFHWYGRIAADPLVDERHRSGTVLTLVTPHGRAEGRLSDVDPWGRFRIAGTGTPPF
jgi:hypothetical protein